MDIKTTVIASIISAVLCSLAASGLTYKYQESYYENVISTAELARQTEITNLTKNVLDTERKNNETTDALNKKYVVQTSEITALRRKLDSYRNSAGGVSVAASCSNATTGTSNEASIRAPASATGVTSRVCELPTVFTTTIIETAVAADILRNTALVCKEYAEAVEKQRGELSNDSK